MSNQLVGNIYRSIMDEVIDSSRVDFEEGGVEEGVLEDLRKVSFHTVFLLSERYALPSFLHLPQNSVPAAIFASESICLLHSWWCMFLLLGVCIAVTIPLLPVGLCCS